MSTRELTRAGVLARVAAGTLSLGSAAAVMAVSYRQAKRLYRRYRAEGARGLKHRSAGRRSNAARDPAEREQILALVREKYSGAIDERFGPTLGITIIPASSPQAKGRIERGVLGRPQSPLHAHASLVGRFSSRRATASVTRPRVSARGDAHGRQ